jgi:hypothetical protein
MMKRIQKSFSVEIRKSRVQAQHPQLPPRPSFEVPQTEIPKIFEKDKAQILDKPPAPPRRILPSIIEPFSGDLEPVETVRHKRSSASAPRGQMEFDLTATASEDEMDAHKPAHIRVEAMADIAIAATVGEDVAPVHNVHSAEGNGEQTNSRKSQKKAFKSAEAANSFGIVSQPEWTSATAAKQSSSSESPFKAISRRLIHRQAAEAQLPRHERWKRRLPSAAW